MGIACINSSRLIKDVLYCKRKAQLWKRFAQSIVLPDLLAEHELTALSGETGHAAVWTVTTVLHMEEKTYVTAMQVQLQI